MIIILSLIIGFILLFCTARLFNKRPFKITHLFFLIAGLFAVNLFIDYDFFNIVISLIIIGASAGFTFRNNKNLRFFIFVSSLSITFIFTFNHYYLKNFKNIDLLMNSKDRLIDIMNKNDISDTEKKQIIQRVDETLDIVEYVVPFAYFFNALVLSFFGFYLIKYVLYKQNKNENNKNGNGGINFEGIERFKVTEYLIFLFIAGWLVVLLVDRSKNYFLYMAGLNIALILSSFYLIQAFGIIKFVLRKKGMPFSLLPAVILSLLFFGIEYFIFILIILSSVGAIDFWVDFRKLELDTKKS